MILLIHQNGQKVVQVLKEGTEIKISNTFCTNAFWELANKYPEEIIAWCEENFYNLISIEETWEDVFHHDLVMASYSIITKFLPNDIGYIDQLPFINLNREVRYPTWRMSTDVGGVNSSVLLKFQSILRDTSNFGYLLNSVAKIGQQNGLFCYSDPALVKTKSEQEPDAMASKTELFSFVSQHYKSIWVLVLFFCLVRYEKVFPLFAFLKSLFKRDFFKLEVDLSGIELETFLMEETNSIDVIIPTIGRPKYLTQVVKDLSEQSLLPKRIIIIEQNPDLEAESEISDLLTTDWPFEIVHHFTHKTGACMARNLALKEIKSDWVFLADDDIRISDKVLEQTVVEAGKLGVDCINLNCKQPGGETVFKKIKQWGSFGSGTSMVKSQFAVINSFSEVFEHGYGEDSDYGMKLRLSGCDIIYHPDLIIEHLKAPIGGFRKKPVLAWEKERPLPKPSPTIMIFSKKYFSEKQLKGYRISLLLKSYSNQPIRNPFKYFIQMQKRWKRSEEWSKKLMVETSDI